MVADAAPLLSLLAAVSGFAAIALVVIDDRADVAIRAARTFVQAGLGAALGALAAPDQLAWSLEVNVLLPAVVAGATVIMGAMVPPERPAEV